MFGGFALKKRIRRPASAVKSARRREHLKTAKYLADSKPVYSNGRITWKGIDFSVKEARELISALSRTPVSQGRFPTEADIIIGTMKDEISTGNISIETLTKLENWQVNYLKAIKENMDRAGDAETQDIYDSLYWEISELSPEKFGQIMDAYSDELSVVFTYPGEHAIEWAERVQGIWQSVLGN